MKHTYRLWVRRSRLPHFIVFTAIHSVHIVGYSPRFRKQSSVKCAAHMLIFALYCSGTVLWIQLNHWFLVVFFIRKAKQSIFTKKHSVSRTWRQQQYNSEYNSYASFIACTFVRSYANLPTPWRRRGGVFKCFRGAWQSLNFYKESLFVFETFIFATLQTVYSIFNSL